MEVQRSVSVKLICRDGKYYSCPSSQKQQSPPYLILSILHAKQKKKKKNLYC